MANKPWQTKSTNQLVPSRRAISDARPGLRTIGAAEREKASRSVKVRARDELIAKHIYHPRGMFRFGDDGIATWPDDQFTARRLRDGDITLVEPRKKREEEPPPKSAASVAVKPKSEPKQPESKPEPKPPSS